MRMLMRLSKLVLSKIVCRGFRHHTGNALLQEVLNHFLREIHQSGFLKTLFGKTNTDIKISRAKIRMHDSCYLWLATTWVRIIISWV